MANRIATALTALVTPNSLYAATGESRVGILGPTGTMTLPEGYFVSSVSETIPGPAGDNRAQVSNPSLSFAPAIVPQTTPSSGGGGQPRTVATASGPTSFGLFSPTGAFLGLIGPGGLLIGNGVLQGQNGGWLMGNGADGGP